MTVKTGAVATRAGTKRAVVLVTTASAAALALAAKSAAETRLAESTVDIGLLQLQLAHNSGVAFGLGNNLPVQLIMAVNATALVAITVYAWRKAPNAGRVQRVAGGAVIGGAAANVVDRARDGLVSDYLHSGWWPTFNLADAFVVTGVLVLALLHVRGERRSAPPSRSRTIPASPPSKRRPSHDRDDHRSATVSRPASGPSRRPCTTGSDPTAMGSPTGKRRSPPA